MMTLAEPALTAPEERTEHPHIIRVPGVCGGRPIVRGSRIAVWHIARLFRAGYTPTEIAQEFSHLPLTGIYDAVSYYLDHQSEVDEEIVANKIENALNAAEATIDERGIVHFSTPTAAE
jgi:uncharacterized protein (DUF433 family)